MKKISTKIISGMLNLFAVSVLLYNSAAGCFVLLNQPEEPEE